MYECIYSHVHVFGQFITEHISETSWTAHACGSCDCFKIAFFFFTHNVGIDSTYSGN